MILKRGERKVLGTTEGMVLLFLGICAVCFTVINFLKKEKSEAQTQAQPPKHPNSGTQVWTRTTEKRWEPDGWYWDEKKGKWVSPDYRNAQANTNMQAYTPDWDNVQSRKTSTVQHWEPTYEEWKAAREGKSDS